MKIALVDNIDIRAVKWIDNRSVIILISYETPQPLSKIKLWDRQQRKVIEDECPFPICTYNKNMGGGDLLDVFLGYYQTPVRKGYQRIDIFLIYAHYKVGQSLKDFY